MRLQAVGETVFPVAATGGPLTTTGPSLCGETGYRSEYCIILVVIHLNYSQASYTGIPFQYSSYRVCTWPMITVHFVS